MKLVYGVRPIPVGVLIVLEVLKAVGHISPITLSFQAYNLPFMQILPIIAFLFFFRTDSTDSLDCLPILLSIPVLYFVVFLFFHF